MMTIDLTFLSGYLSNCSWGFGQIISTSSIVWMVLGALMIVCAIILASLSLDSGGEAISFILAIILCLAGIFILGVGIKQDQKPKYNETADYASIIQTFREEVADETNLVITEADANNIIGEYAIGYYLSTDNTFTDFKPKEVVLYDAQNNAVRMTYIMNSQNITFSYTTIDGATPQTKLEQLEAQQEEAANQGK